MAARTTGSPPAPGRGDSIPVGRLRGLTIAAIPLALTPGTRIGRYEILSALGVLPPSLANDPDRLARFQREAEVLATLNHPHIAAIYGLEETAGVTALVMELVEGEDLARRIARGLMPLEEALPIARQIAEALEAAPNTGSSTAISSRRISKSVRTARRRSWTSVSPKR